jgi:hypothetical protein
VLAGVLGAGCGGDPLDISGVYRTTQHLLDPLGCGEGAPESEPPYFGLQKGKFIYVDYFDLQECTSAEHATCDPGFGLFFDFVEERDGGWYGELSYASGGSGSCTLGYTESFARSEEVEDGRSLHITIEEHLEEDASLIGEACSSDEATARGKDMPCVSREALQGTWEAEFPEAMEE